MAQLIYIVLPALTSEYPFTGHVHVTFKVTHHWPSYSWKRVSNGLIGDMVLNGLRDSFKPLAVHATQNKDNVMFADFKIRVYEEREKMSQAESTDNVMKTHVKQWRGPTKTHTGNKKDGDLNMMCYRCNKRAQDNKLNQKSVMSPLYK